MMYTMRAVLEKEYGQAQTKKLLVEAGRVAGSAFAKNVLDTSLELPAFIANIHEKLLALNIGILRVEKSDVENLSFVVTVSEDLDCSGLPVNGSTVCDYDEGFIEGIFNVYTGKKFAVKEIACWSTGDRTCRFDIHPV